MRFYVILGLLLSIALAEEKVNLEDIERDNSKAQDTSESETLSTAETKYPAKTEVRQGHYQGPTDVYYEAGNEGEHPTSSQAYTNQRSNHYSKGKYSENDLAYQPPSDYLTNSQQSQYYTDIESKDNSQLIYDIPQTNYQPEVVVGNQWQTVQQKTAATKYNNNGKGVYYANYPIDYMMYYTNSGLNPVRNENHHQMTSPVYKPATNKQAHTGRAHGSQATSNTYAVPVEVLMNPIYSQSKAVHSQPKKSLYTQAYINQPQSQYLQPLIYSHPGSPVYTDLENVVPGFIQDNSIHNQPHDLYVSTTIAEQLMNQILQQVSHQTSVNHQRTKIYDTASPDLKLPQYTAQKFRTATTQLIPVSSGKEGYGSKIYSATSEPQTLLDSYVPSHIIAAQDAQRYKERPIKLESGFLPSKINFVHSYKKRKSE